MQKSRIGCAFDRVSMKGDAPSCFCACPDGKTAYDQRPLSRRGGPGWPHGKEWDSSRSFLSGDRMTL